MRTIKSALFIALCLMFASYATALRKHFPRGPTKFIRPIRPTRPMADRTLPYYKPWSPPPFVMADSDLSIMERRPWTGPPPFVSPMADRAVLPFEKKPWIGTPPFNPYPTRPVTFSDLKYTTLPVRPKYTLFADSEIYPPRGDWSSTGPYNPNPRPILFSDSEYRMHPDWIKTTGPYNPGPIIKRPDILFSDAEASILPHIPTYPTKPWTTTTGPYAPTIPPLTTFDDAEDFEEDVEEDEDFDEEQWGINGSVSNGGNWNLGGSYSGNIGRNGNWNIGGGISNGGNWNVGAGVKFTF